MSVFGGDQWRPLLHVKDVANAIDNTIEKMLMVYLIYIIKIIKLLS